MEHLDIFNWVDPKTFKNKYRDIIYAEADKGAKPKDKDEVTVTTDDMSMIVMGKSIDKFDNITKRIMITNDGVANDVLETAQKLQKICESIAKVNNDKSKSLSVFSKLVATLSSQKKFFKALSHDKDKSAGNVLVSATLFMTIEASAILSEATNEIVLGNSKTYDDYVYKANKTYNTTFDAVESFVGAQNLNKLQSELYKESFGDVSFEGLHTETVSTLMTYSEGTSVSLMKVMKALLFKTLYIVMSPVRYIIYLFLYAGYSISERIQQIKDTIAMYDKGTGSIEKDGKLDSLTKVASKARMDRIEANSKVQKEIEADKKDNAVQVNTSYDF